LIDQRTNKATKANTDIKAILKATTTEFASALHSLVQFYHEPSDAGTGLGKLYYQQE